MSQWCRSALCGHPVPALTDNWTHGAASRHTIAPISHTRPSSRTRTRSYYSFPFPLRVGGWVSLSTQYVSNMLKVACSGPGVSRTRNLLVTSPILYQLDHCKEKKTLTRRTSRSRRDWAPAARSWCVSSTCRLELWRTDRSYQSCLCQSGLEHRSLRHNNRINKTQECHCAESRFLKDQSISTNLHLT